MSKPLTENQQARAAGIPKWLRQYNARYGQGGVAGIVATHLQNPAPRLDHGRDRAAMAQGRPDCVILDSADGGDDNGAA